MSPTIVQAFSLSIVLPAAISAFRCKVADRSYFPFLLLLWIGTANEVVSVVLMNLKYHTAINNNVYVLAASVVILQLYRKLLEDEMTKMSFYLLLAFFILIWIAENFLFSTITRVGSYFRIAYSFVTVILSINLVNRLLFSEKGVSLRSPSLLICLCFIVFFTYKILVEAFWIYGLNDSPAFRTHVYTLLICLNLFFNLVYILVTLWIPRKPAPLLFS